MTIAPTPTAAAKTDSSLMRCFLVYSYENLHSSKNAGGWYRVSAVECVRARGGNEEKRLSASCCQPFTLSANRQLPVSTATTVSTAAAVEAAATAAAVTPATQPGASAMVSPATGVAASVPSSGIITSIAASVTPASVASSIAASVASSVGAPIAPTTVSTMSPAPVIPRSGTNECSAHKPLRTVEAIRCAGIGVIGVVAVRTHGRPANITRIGVALIGIALIGIALICGALVGIALVGSDANSRFNLRLRVSKRQH